MNSESKMNKLAEYVGQIDQSAPARARLSALFDADTFVELDAFAENGVVTGYGYVGENLVYAFSQSGAVTKVHAKKVKKVYELAAKVGCPVVGIYDSNGAKVSEANEMLAAYAEILALSNKISGVVPQIALVLGTCAGTSALMAASADFVVMSKEAELFLNAPFVTTAKGGSKEAGTAAFLAEGGVASIVGETEEETIEEVKKLLSVLPENNLAPAPLFEAAAAADGASVLSAYAKKPEGCVCKVVAAIADEGSVVTLGKDYAKGVYTALATVGGSPIGFIASNEEEGSFGVKACNKAAKFVRVCDAYNIPVVTMLNTKGFEMTACPGLIKGAAKLAGAYAEATTAKVNVVMGEVIGAAYLATCVADVTVAWPTGVISAMAPEAYVEFVSHDKLKGTADLKADRQKLAEEYIDEEAGAFKAAENGFVDAVIAPETTRDAVLKALEMLSGKRVSAMPKKHSNAL